MAYQRADTDWLAACTLGIGIHWTAKTVPRSGPACPFSEAVANFRLPAFLDAVETSGADYVLFTATHALQMFACPHPVVDAILPGRTSERDLLGEIARGLADRGVKLIMYYNHSCNHGNDPAWEHAVGYHGDDKQTFARNICAIVRWLGQTYGDLIRAWWFDSSYSVDPRGPHNSVSTDLHGFQFPWEELTRAAKEGFANRLVTYNAGIAETFLYTDHQDYWAGELTDLKTPPSARFLDSGLQWHGWTCLDDQRWVYGDNREPPRPPLYPDAELLAFLRTCRGCQAPMAFNVVSFQDGSLAEASILQLQRLSTALRTI